MIQVFCGGLSQHLFTEEREEVVGSLHPQHTVITMCVQKIPLLHYCSGGLWG